MTGTFIATRYRGERKNWTLQNTKLPLGKDANSCTNLICLMALALITKWGKRGCVLLRLTELLGVLRIPWPGSDIQGDSGGWWEVMVSLWENAIKWSEVNEAKWSGMRWSELQYREAGRGEERVFMEKVYRSSKWWEVKDWGESASELMIVKKKPLQKTVHRTLFLGCFYLLYMLYSNLSQMFYS